MTNIYIKNHPDEMPPKWWENFESTLVQRYVGTDALRRHIEDRRNKLEAAGAFLKWDKDSGLPYLEFKEEKNAVKFVLKWA